MTALLVALVVFGSGLADRLIAYTHCYAESMNLQQWDITIVFEPLADAEAATEADPTYLFATIRYDTTKVRGQGDEYLRWLVRHELFHVWIWELSTYAERGKHRVYALNLEEQLGSQFARWPAWDGICRP